LREAPENGRPNPAGKPADRAFGLDYSWPVLLLGVLAVLLSVFARTQEPPPDDGWKGIFYSNPDDPALFVPKRFGIGYTLNFGNPWSWVVVALILAMVALPLGLSIATRHGLR
jgi:hypothetical protein